MASKTLYQKQADKRTKNSLKLRARYDGKVRKYATLLAAALAGAADARERINRLNTLYNVDISTETLLVHDLRTSGLAATLTTEMAASTPGEEVQIFTANVDGNGGSLLAFEGLFGEVAAAPTGTPTAPAAPTTAPAPTYGVTLTGPKQDAQGVTLAASAGDTLGFDALTTGGAAPFNMQVSVGGTQAGSVTFLDRYNGKPFTFTHAGVAHTGSFAAFVNF